mmetsp:Transcript_29980/g.70675  ORF Transcript_29980/g.70675 Transcript_29980/m.70675 type:complete len:83 (-) Transcript_29980:1251-1499(-)
MDARVESCKSFVDGSSRCEVFIHSFIHPSILSIPTLRPTLKATNRRMDGTIFENENKRPGSWSSSIRESYSIPTKESNGNKK